MSANAPAENRPVNVPVNVPRGNNNNIVYVKKGPAALGKNNQDKIDSISQGIAFYESLIPVYVADEKKIRTVDITQFKTELLNTVASVDTFKSNQGSIIDDIKGSYKVIIKLVGDHKNIQDNLKEKIGILTDILTSTKLRTNRNNSNTIIKLRSNNANTINPEKSLIQLQDSLQKFYDEYKGKEKANNASGNTSKKAIYKKIQGSLGEFFDPINDLSVTYGKIKTKYEADLTDLDTTFNTNHALLHDKILSKLDEYYTKDTTAISTILNRFDDSASNQKLTIYEREFMKK
jgi:hypothetical protein